MNHTVETANDTVSARRLFAVPLAQSFVTVLASTLALIVLCFVFAPSSLTLGALEGSVPFAAIIAIVGLAQLLVVQQGGFDLSVAGGVSLAVVISTHYPDGDNALLAPAVLIAAASALAAGLANGVLVGFLNLNAIIATIGVNALLYGGVFAVSGGTPRITTRLLASIAGGETLGVPNSVYFRAGGAAAGLLRPEEDGRRAAVRGDRRQSAGGARGRAEHAHPSHDGLCVFATAVLPGGRSARRHHARTHRISGRQSAAAFRRGRRSRAERRCSAAGAFRSRP